MKKTVLSILTCLTIGIGVHAQNVVIPDVNFKNALLAHGASAPVNGVNPITSTGITLIDTNNDGEIQVSEAQAYSGAINCSSQNISDLTGIESFTALTVLFCHSNQLDTLNLSQNTNLNTLWCQNNQLDTLNVTANQSLVELWCNHNNLTSIDISQNINLTSLRCQFNQLDSLNVTANQSLVELWCNHNSLTSIDISQNINLTSFRCSNNELVSLDVTQNTLLTQLWCDVNQISNIDVTQNTALSNLRIHQNALTELDVSQNSSLTSLWCQNNEMISLSLDVTQNTLLNQLWCQNNQLYTLNVSANQLLSDFRCNGNLLSYLNVANGNNVNFTNFYANGNPDLTCIVVDDVTYSTNNWTNIDAQTSFSLNCGETILVNEITVQGQGGVSTISSIGGTLQMNATVLPTNANDGTYTWSVNNGTGMATIDANGLLTATADGMVDVIATANDGSGVTGSATITISNQSASINENTISFSIVPNPTSGMVKIDTDVEINSVEIFSTSGKQVASFNSKSFDVSSLQSGVYFVKVLSDSGLFTTRIIRE